VNSMASHGLGKPIKTDCRVIFIVGPSGVGKSTLVRKFMANSGAEFKPIWLDRVATEEALARGIVQGLDPATGTLSLLKKVGHEGLVVIGIAGLFRRLRAATDGEIYLVDVGAGFQAVDLIARLSLLYPVIGITASEEAAFERFCKYRPINLSFDGYTRTQYTRINRDVYASATHLIDTTDLSLDETAIRFESVVREIVKGQPVIDDQGSNSKPAIQFLDFAAFERNALDNPGSHWDNYKGRWKYYSRAVEIAKTLDINNPSDVLEMGTMGVSIVPNCLSIDYDEKWDFIDKKPTYRHDARAIPWPVPTKKFKLFVALRVFHHLAPKQKECFLEAKRIAENVLIVVPNEYHTGTGITLDQLTDWNDGEPPTIVENVLDPSNFLYHWKFGP
jgi:GTPase SAR1 family protein